jgi:hypothetical protein
MMVMDSVTAFHPGSLNVYMFRVLSRLSHVPLAECIKARSPALPVAEGLFTLGGDGVKQRQLPP